jgi:gamma-glutamyltranspeptidase/glutathione hydrolase
MNPAAGGTSAVTAADAEGNAVVLIHSNSFPQYGSGLVVEPWDLILNNRPGRGFDLDAPAEAPNAPRAGRVPATTLHAWALERPGRTLLGGTPGGVNQMPWNCQTILDCLADDRDLGRVVLAPRWAMDEADNLTCEADHARAGTADARIVDPLSLRSVEQILRLDRAGERLQAAADPRTGAQVAGL